MAIYGNSLKRNRERLLRTVSQSAQKDGFRQCEFNLRMCHNKLASLCYGMFEVWSDYRGLCPAITLTGQDQALPRRVLTKEVLARRSENDKPVTLTFVPELDCYGKFVRGRPSRCYKIQNPGSRNPSRNFYLSSVSPPDSLPPSSAGRQAYTTAMAKYKIKDFKIAK